MTTRRYAQDTTVPVERTIGEIQAMVRRVGGTHWAYGEQDDHQPPLSVIQFRLKGFTLRFTVRHPSPREVMQTEAGRTRSGEILDRAVERELMRRWRALGLLIKAQLTAISEGVVSVEQAMLANVVLPATGATMGDWIAPRIASLQAGQGLPQLPARSEVSITEET